MMRNLIYSKNKMPYGLKDTDIQRIKQVFAPYSEVERVVLYGSRAKGNFKPASDIDLTLYGEKLTLTLQYKIENDLDDLLLPYKMDVSIFHRISNPDLTDHINRIGQVFMKKSRHWRNDQFPFANNLDAFALYCYTAVRCFPLSLPLQMLRTG
ncbi:putative nucleotidyltransferase [Bacteroidales bacterium Barb6]|nr:putative nucleotidyltransferase [Bacteroidales bacterium Barb6]